MIRRLLVPGSPLMAAVAVVKSEESADGKKEKNLICKPSALPIYTTLVDRWLSVNARAIPSNPLFCFSDIKPQHEYKPSKVAEAIEGGVKSVRQEVSKVTDVYDSQKANLERYYVKAMKDTQRKWTKTLKFLFLTFCQPSDIRNYLQEEDNTMPRVGAIAVGSLAGVVLGVRGGFFKKIFYASITGSAVASVCYPRDAKRYAQVVYNFAYGIKPGDERQKDLPKFPTTFGELKDNVVSLSSMAYEAAFGKK